VLDGTTIMSYGLEFAPALIAILAAALAVWIVWRLVRRVLQFFTRKPDESTIPASYAAVQERREPVLGPPAAPSPPSIPDAADVLALKASIDALTRQIASLERKLAPAPEAPAAPAPVVPILKGEDAQRAPAKASLAS